MRRTVIGLLAFLTAAAAMAQTGAKDPEAGTVAGNQFRSAFFDFRYEFPKGWTYLDPVEMRAENAEASRKAAEESLKKNGPDGTFVSGNTTTTRTTKLYANFTLLIAAPTAVNTAEKGAAPRVEVWAHERVPNLLNDAGDHAKIVAMLGETIIMPATEVTLDGHKFVRIDVRHKDGLYHADVETVCGDYIVGFDFFARTPEELHAVTETLNTLRFD